MSKFEKVPNQRTINIHKEICNADSKQNYYAKINQIALEKACKTLSGNAFKFWIYLSRITNGTEWILSKVATIDYCNFCPSTYTSVFKELVNNGYLVEKSKDVYDFYELPKIEDEQIIIIPHKAETDFKF